MKPITFENLRRLMGGGRKKKDRAESSFKRSDSFKRISIKRHYHERGNNAKAILQQQHNMSSSAAAAALAANPKNQPQPLPPPQIKLPPPPTTPPPPVTPPPQQPPLHLRRGFNSRHPLGKPIPPSGNSTPSKKSQDSPIIGYRQWIHGIKDNDKHSSSAKVGMAVAQSPGGGGSSPSIIRKQEKRRPTPPPRTPPRRPKGPSLATESPPAGGNVDILVFDRSPVVSRRRSRPSPPPALPSAATEVSPSPSGGDSYSEWRRGGDSIAPSVGVSLGRIWMDPPPSLLSFAPRSLELPSGPQRRLPTPPCGADTPTRQSSSGAEGCGGAIRRPQHHSLDSALKERREAGRPLSPPSLPPAPPPGGLLSRTLSSTQTTQSGSSKTLSSRDSTDRVSSSKDSGFSFSISIPRLSDLTGSSAATGRFFKGKNSTRPKPSVSRDGYFKRTSSVRKSGSTKQLFPQNQRVSSTRKGKRSQGVGEAPSSRGQGGRRRKNGAGSGEKADIYQVVIGRPPRSLRSLKLDPMIFVPPEKRRPRASTNRKKSDNHVVKYEVKEIRDLRVTPVDPSVRREASGRVTIHVVGKEEEDEDEGLYECVGGEGSDLPSPEDFWDPSVPVTRGPPEGTSDHDDPEYEERLSALPESASEGEDEEEGGSYVPIGVSPVPRRRPVRRRKSAARRNVKYVARRSAVVVRAPSTLRRRKTAAAVPKKSSDITQKGYEKKRSRLLSPYVPKQAQGPGGAPAPISSRQQPPRAKKTQRRVTHNEKRYHSEVRQEAVQQALAAMQGRPKPSLPMPSKRTSVMARSPDRERRDSASSSDEDSLVNEGDARESTPEREMGSGGRGEERGGGRGSSSRPPAQPPPSQGSHQSPDTSSTGSARDTPPQQRAHRPERLQPLPLPSQQQQPQQMRLPNGGPGIMGWEEHRGNESREERKRMRQEITDLSDVMHNLRPYTQPPDVTHNTAQSRRMTAADRVNRYNQSRQSSASDDMGTVTGTGRWKVSAKIQQLLNTLKRPKRRPLPEFYEDDDIELEIAANPKDPNAPKPEGGCMTPAVGEQLVVPSGLPRNLESAIQRYGSATFKAPVATVLDPNGKLSITLTYGKLLSRSQKIAYTLLNKAFSKGDSCLKSGDRVALVYPNNDPINFICAFYGCLQAGVVPVPIEVPLTRRDAGSQQIGFLLGSCGIQVALTSEACLKGLPKTAAGEVVAFKGWPKLQWFVTEHLAKTPKEWLPPPRLTDDTPAYIEYTTDKDGSAMGVTVTRAAMLAHCRTLTMGCNYTEGDVMVCVLDFKREVGLWHSVLASVLNGMHVVFIPYALMKVNPASWMQMITKYRASVAVVKSRDLHWGLLATKDHKEVVLSSLRLLLVADGANPWSLSSCDQFLSVFQSKGLRSDAICPCASSSEALTVSIRRPGRAGVNSTGRGVLSMSGLSYGVVRVDQENSLTSLTLQDCGQVMPGCVIGVVKIEGQSYLCKTDEVGEICVQSAATGNQYWGLQGLTNSTFRVQPLQSDGKPIGEGEFVRSGLLGFLGPGGLVFVCGSRDGLMTVTGRKHNADDIIATVLAVEPMKFIYRGRIAVFSIRVLRDERICVIAEQRPDCSEEESFQWMSRVLQAVDSIHQVGIYCLALVPPNYLPKTPLGGIHLSETKRRFLEGTLHPANVLLCPHTTVTNLPKPREIHADVGPASVMVGNIVQGNRLASAQGRDMGIVDEESDSARKYQFISEILRWRAMTTPDHVIFTLLNSKGAVATMLSCSQLHKKAERVGCLLLEKGKINTGDHVALIYPPGVDLICAFYGCLYVGAVPVTIRPPHPQNLQTTLPTVRMIVDVSKSVLVLSNQNVIKLLKSKEASNVVDIKSWPITLDTDDTPKKKLAAVYRAPTAEMLAYLDFSVSTTGMLAGIKMSHAAVTSLCRSMKLACELYPSRHIALCLDPYCGLGFALWCLSSIYSGHHSILIPPSEVEVNPALWLTAVSQNRVRDTFCSYGVMELCTKGLGSSVNQLKQRGVNLACVRTCVVVAEERPRMALTNGFSKLFSALGLSPRAVSTSFGCRVNVAICLQGASSPEPSTVYVDLRALRNDRVSLVERGSPHSLCLMESGKLLPGVKVIIANPDTKGQCGDSHLGEIWVQSPHNASGYFTIYGDESDYGDHFNARLVTGNTGETYARTGYLGFLRRTESVQSDTPATGGDEVSVGGGSVGSSGAVTTVLPTGVGGELSQQLVPTSLDGSQSSLAMGEKELHDAVFVVGALDETIMLRGMRYHPIDIENSVLRSHKKIAECAVFTWTNLLVVVVELDGNENEALDLVPLVTNAVLEEHHLVVGVAVVVDPGVVPVNSRGEKQRMHLRDGFLADQLDPIYVAYNM